jgi:3-dehydroquinate dehydratase type II
MRRVLVVNGPNLNLLGQREPQVYGRTTLAQLDDRVRSWGQALGVEVETFQSNHEGALIDRLHAARSSHHGVVLNPGALTHYSYALHDAVLATELPTVEVHISNTQAREEWRRRSVTAPACVAVIFGRGLVGYRDALAHLVWRTAWEPETLRYGPAASQVGDLRVPVGAGPFPVAVVLHGGFWRQVWARDLMDGVAVTLARRGWATWNIEYRRVGEGGGWPETLHDVADAVDHLEELAAERPLDLHRVVTIGHSAGGHLALWAVARGSLPLDAPGAVPQVRPVAAAGLAPVADLAAAHAAGIGEHAVQDFIGAAPADGPQRYAVADPAALLPFGVRQLIVHGEADDEVPLELSAHYVGNAADAGDSVVFHELSDVGHYELIDPATDAWSVVEAELSEL